MRMTEDGAGAPARYPEPGAPPPSPQHARTQHERGQRRRRAARRPAERESGRRRPRDRHRRAPVAHSLTCPVRWERARRAVEDMALFSIAAAEISRSENQKRANTYVRNRPPAASVAT